MRRTATLICDLDNTLYDWVEYFVPAFYALVDEAMAIMDCDRDTLLDDLRSVHIRHHDTEHPFSLLETDTVKRVFGGDVGRARLELDPAFHAFNSRRKDALRLFDGVRDALLTLRAEGVHLVGHTESRVYAAEGRLARLDILDSFDFVFCQELGEGQKGGLLESRHSNTIELSRHQSKPNPSVLIEICERIGTDVSHAAYVGDSIAKDVMMAKDAGVFAIWARYGAAPDSAKYEKLVRVSHWTSEDVRREAHWRNRAVDVVPDLTIDRFDEIVVRMP